MSSQLTDMTAFIDHSGRGQALLPADADQIFRAALGVAGPSSRYSTVNRALLNTAAEQFDAAYNKAVNGTGVAPRGTEGASVTQRGDSGRTEAFTSPTSPYMLGLVNIDDVRKALSAGDLEVLIGLEECGWMDVKSEPYMLSKAHRKEELVKDVAAFANTSTGGLLIIGFKTRTANAVETVSEVTPVPRVLVNTDTYRKLIDERVYPQVQGLELTWIDRSEARGC